MGKNLLSIGKNGILNPLGIVGIPQNWLWVCTYLLVGDSIGESKLVKPSCGNGF